MDSDKDKLLEDMFYPDTGALGKKKNVSGTLKDPAGRMYGRNNLYRLMKEHLNSPKMKQKYPGMEISRDYVGKWLKDQETAQMYAPARKTTQTQQFVPTSPFNQISCDLLNFRYRQVKKKNYILIVIDNFSRYAYTVAIKDKTQAIVSKAMQSVFNKIEVKYRRNIIKFLVTDGGDEFKGATDDVFKAANIKVKRTNPGSPWQNGMCERAGGKIKKILAKMLYPPGIPVTRKAKKKVKKDGKYEEVVLEAVKTKPPNPNWVDYLQSATAAYNAAHNRGIGMSSNDALGIGSSEVAKMTLKERIELVKANNLKAYSKYYEDKDVVVNQTSKLKVGDTVRLKLIKTPLTKGTDPNWSKKEYTVTKVITDDMPQNQDKYEINKKAKGGAAKAQWYRNDLLLANKIQTKKDTTFKVGREVKVLYEDGVKYKGRITRVNKDSLRIKWLEGDDKDMETRIPKRQYNLVELVS